MSNILLRANPEKTRVNTVKVNIFNKSQFLNITCLLTEIEIFLLSSIGVLVMSLKKVKIGDRVFVDGERSGTCIGLTYYPGTFLIWFDGEVRPHGTERKRRCSFPRSYLFKNYCPKADNDPTIQPGTRAIYKGTSDAATYNIRPGQEIIVISNGRKASYKPIEYTVNVPGRFNYYDIPRSSFTLLSDPSDLLKALV